MPAAAKNNAMRRAHSTLLIISDATDTFRFIGIIEKF